MDAVALPRALHLLAAVLWVGGMAFAHFVLRPAVAGLPPRERFALWRRVFGRFLPVAGTSALVLLATGHLLIPLTYGELAHAPLFVHAMLGLGWVMALVYAVIVAGPWRRFRTAVDAGDGEGAAAQLSRIRRLVTVNLVLGVAVVLIAGLRAG